MAFSKVGCAKASIRDIAAEAGITAALVVRYFGSKENLFEEAVAEAFDLRETLDTTERGKLGEAMAALIGGRDAEQRAAMFLSVVTGLWFYRFKLPLKPLSGRPAPELVGEVAAILQRLIDGAD